MGKRSDKDMDAIKRENYTRRKFEDAAMSFATTPSATNWRSLKRTMALYQAEYFENDKLSETELVENELL